MPLFELTGPDDAFLASFLPRFTAMFYTDEEGIANALYNECGIDMDKVYAVFLELYKSYTNDSDDVAKLYVEIVKRSGGSVAHALTLHQPLKGFLIRLLDEGWTSAGEQTCIQYLRGL